MAAQRFGGTRLVGRHYFLREREVEVLTGWGPGAAIRNVRVRFLDTGAITVRPFRGLTKLPRPGRTAQSPRTASDRGGRTRARNA